MAILLSRRAPLVALAMAVLVSISMSTSRPASADEASKKRAYELYQQSIEKYRAGKFKEAAALLRQAYALEADPVLLYNLGRACEGTGELEDIECAIDAYERYLAVASPPDRGAIEKKLATLKSQREMIIQSRRTPDRPVERSPSALPWIVTGLGLATVTTGVVLSLVARGKHQQAVDDPEQRSAAQQLESAQSTNRLANVGLIAGGVLTAVGITWIVLDRDTPSANPKGATSASVGVGASSLWLTVAF